MTAGPDSRLLREQREAALGFCNWVRKEAGRGLVSELERGDLSSPLSCPLARTIGKGALVTATRTMVEAPYPYGGVFVDNPRIVQGFIASLDAGAYPDLVVP